MWFLNWFFKILCLESNILTWTCQQQARIWFHELTKPPSNRNTDYSMKYIKIIYLMQMHYGERIILVMYGVWTTPVRHVDTRVFWRKLIEINLFFSSRFFMSLPNEIIFLNRIHIDYTCFNIIKSKHPCNRESTNLRWWIGSLVHSGVSNRSIFINVWGVASNGLKRIMILQIKTSCVTTK